MKNYFGKEEIIDYVSAADGTIQQSLLYRSPLKGKQPLLVAFHTWSGDMYQNSTSYQKFAEKYGFHLVHPNFRGPNWRKEGCGSDKAVGDIEGLVQYVCSILEVDEKRIYAMGGSGGGHFSLLVAGRLPGIWAGVSSWVPISDVKKWHKECYPRPGVCGYSRHIEQALGGDPNKDPVLGEEALKRSPVRYLEAAKKIPLDINTGIHDGHRGSVPVSQALEAYNLLADKKDRISEKDIKYMVEKEAIPAHLQNEKEDDPSYGKLGVLFRRISGNVRITVFEGGHDMAYAAGVGFVANQKKGRKADWKLVEAEESANGEVAH